MPMIKFFLEEREERTHGEDTKKRPFIKKLGPM